ncbi:MAG: hypothetical protein ACREYE_12820 [Gammaproteobacteria bacterium]
MEQIKPRSTLPRGKKEGGLTVKLFKGHYTRSLSDLGDRSEASGESRTVFRSFEANSAFYLTKMIGKMNRFPIAAVDSS